MDERPCVNRGDGYKCRKSNMLCVRCVGYTPLEEKVPSYVVSSAVAIPQDSYTKENIAQFPSVAEAKPSDNITVKNKRR